MEIGSLRVGLGLDSAAFQAGVQQVSRSTQTLQDRLARAAAGHDKFLMAAERAGGALSEQGRLMQMAVGSFAGITEAANRAAASADAFAEALAIRDRVAALHASMSPLVAATQRYDAAVDQVNRALEVGAIAQSEANTVLALAKRRFDDAAAAAKRMDASADLAATSIRRVGTAGGTGIQNVAFQMQDLAVQIGAGTSAAQALGQQLPQLLSGFGAMGAVAGVLAAVMIPVAGYFWSTADAADGASEAMDRLMAATRAYSDAAEILGRDIAELREEYGRYAEAIRDAARETARNAVQSARDELSAVAAGTRETLEGILADAERARDALANASIIRAETGANSTAAQAYEDAAAAFAVQARAAAESLGLTVEQARGLVAVMAELDSAKTMDEIAAASANAVAYLDGLSAAAGGLPAPLREARAELLDVMTSSAQAADLMNDATTSAAGLASNLGLAAQSAYGLGGAGAGVLSWISSATAMAGGLASRMWGAAQAALAFMQRRAAGLSYVDSNQPGGTGYLASQYALYGAGQQSMRQAQRELEYAVAPIIGGGGGAGGAGGVASALDDAAEAAKDLREELEKPMVSAIDGVANAFGEFVAGGLRDFKGFVDSVLGSFTKMLSQMVAQAVANPIKLALGFGGTAVGGAGQAIAEVAGQAGDGGLLSSISGAAGGFLGGIGSGLQAALGTGGFASAGIFNVAANAATAAATGVSALSATIGAAIPVVAGIAAVFSFFRTRTKTLDTGIRVAIDGVEALTESFEVIEKKKLWGLSRKVSETFGSADRELVDAVQDTYTSLRESVLDMGSVLGIGARALNGFVEEIKLSTRGMSPEEAQQAVLAEFEKLGVKMAQRMLGTFTENVVDRGLVARLEAQLSAVLASGSRDDDGNLDWFTRHKAEQIELQLVAARAGTEVRHLNAAFEALRNPGESALDLLTRLSSSFLAANHAMRALGHSLFETTAAGIRASARLVEAMGGLEQFQRGIDFFFQNFYSVQEQAAFATRDFASSIRELGLGSVPRTMEQFRAMVDRLMDAGRVNAAGELINLAPAFVELLRLRQEIRGIGEDSDEAADRLERNRRRADEREDLERRLLELQRNTAELRRRELAALGPAKRALQRMSWGLEDAQAAMEALDEEDFATLFDFQRARGRAAAGMQAYQPLPVPQAQVAVTTDPGVERRLDELNTRLTQIMTTVAQTSRQTAQVLRKWDNIGLPAEQVA